VTIATATKPNQQFSTGGKVGSINKHILYEIVWLCKYIYMSRPSKSNKALPFAAADALIRLGASLRIARERRNESLRAWAERMNTSVPTLSRMESGDPAVGMGVYAVGLWLAGKASDLGALAAPEKDTAALAMDIRRAQRSRVRRP
jgi:hypothetical protein